MEEAGAVLARQEFPYEALLMSLHFLEESYMSFLLEPPTERAIDWLVGMDEFLHAVLASIASSYFRAQRRTLLEQVEIGVLLQEALQVELPAEVGDLDIGSVYQSARPGAKIGGDFFDLVSIGDREAAFIVADVSGSGLEAASDSMMLRSLFRGFLGEDRDLMRLLERLNAAARTEFDPFEFATAQVGLYAGEGKLQLVSAGHPYPLVCREGACEFIAVHGVALGIQPEPSWAPVEIGLERGDVMVSYTDGLTDARYGKSQFGEEGISAAVEEVRDAPAAAIAVHLLDAARRFARGELNDDVAVLVLKRH
jgi:serine phosphatase RsbU (regulator of sigma subunit)